MPFIVMKMFVILLEIRSCAANLYRENDNRNMEFVIIPRVDLP